MLIIARNSVNFALIISENKLNPQIQNSIVYEKLENKISLTISEK